MPDELFGSVAAGSDIGSGGVGMGSAGLGGLAAHPMSAAARPDATMRVRECLWFMIEL
jgi:hypothetical protein